MTTHTQLLQTLFTTDMVISKTELIDVDVLDILSKNDKISIDDHKKLSSLKKKLSNGNELDVLYKLGKSMKTEDCFMGRLCATKGIGLQTLNRNLRSALAQRFYWDVDVVACQPTLALQLCEKYKISCSLQKEFLENREKYMVEMCETLHLDRDKAKARINALYFGYDTASSGMSKELVNLHQEIITCRNYIVNHSDWIEQVKFTKNKMNRVGCSFAFILQTLERSILLQMDISASKNNRKLDVLIHDGGLIQKLVDEKEFPNSLLEIFQTDIEKSTGFTIRLCVKPMNTTLDIQKLSSGNYELAKVEFEKTCFKINNPACYARQYNNEVSFIDSTKLSHIYANKYVDEELFITKWKTDPTNITYERVEFLPGLSTPSDTFNLWRGYDCIQKEGDISVILELLQCICSFDTIAFEYLVNWLAHMFQKPWEKPKVCIISQSDEEGTGKDTTWNFIGSMVGNNMFFNTGRPEDCVFGRFNGSLKEVMLLKFEEADFETNRKNEGGLKTLITCDSVSYESKNENAVTLKSSVRLVMTTNVKNPIMMSDTARRFVMLRASSIHRGDTAYWENVHKVLATKDARSAFYDYLMKRDITNFSPQKFPMTTYGKEVMGACRPQSARFFQRTIETAYAFTDTPDPITWNARELLNLINDKNKFNMSDQTFGREMTKYTSGLEKIKDRLCNKYVCDPVTMREFLESKNWWIEL